MNCSSSNSKINSLNESELFAYKLDRYTLPQKLEESSFTSSVIMDLM